MQNAVRPWRSASAMAKRALEAIRRVRDGGGGGKCERNSVVACKLSSVPILTCLLFLFRFVLDVLIWGGVGLQVISRISERSSFSMPGACSGSAGYGLLFV